MRVAEETAQETFARPIEPRESGRGRLDGYTNVGMAVSKLLGFDLCPRLRNLSARKLYLPRGMEVATDLAPIVDHGISLKPIRDGWS